MAIESGYALGPYLVVAKLGAGGMGEVYRARDQRLGREVALKVIRGGSLRDSELRRRLIGEANAAAALNHPNIVSVFDVSLEGETPYVVSELVDGEPLARLIERGPIPARKLVDIATQIADGLAAAHHASIVHRDLKPANILLTREGRAKIADFGLAKSLASADEAADESSPTVSLTQIGVVQGSVDYMSPEQARGEVVDTRSDVFSFGLILYEMAVGRRPFTRRSVVETLNAIIKDDAPPLPPDLPQGLTRCIERCIQKEPADRYNSTRDLYNELRSLKEDYGATGAITRAVPAIAPPLRRRIVYGIAAGAVLASAVVAIAVLMPASIDVSAIRFQPLATSADWEDWPAWSPKGGTIAYQARVDGVNQIFTRSLQAPSGVQITQCPADCERPQWSADARQIYVRTPNGISVVGAAGGDPKPLLPEAEAFAVSPDGRTLAIIRRNADRSGISVWLSSPPGAEPVHYEPAPFEGVDTGTGLRLLFKPDGTGLLLWGRFFGRGSEFWMLPLPAGSGAPRRVMEELRDAFPMRGFDWIEGGKRLVLAATLPPLLFRSHLFTADPKTGAAQLLVGGIGSESVPAVAPGGKQIAYTAMHYDTDVVEIPLNGGRPRPLIATSRLEHSAVWSPKGRELAYVTDRSGADELWIRNVDTGREMPVAGPQSFPGGAIEFLTSPVFSPDGERLAFVRHNRENTDRRDATEIWIVPATGGAPVQLTTLKGAQWTPSWSPDGKFIAFTCQGPPSGVMKVRVGGNEPPEMLWQLDVLILNMDVEWSPRGDWIAVPSKKGLMLLSPDAKQQKVLRSPYFRAMTWSRDGSILYGHSGPPQKERIVAVDIASGREKEVAEIPPDMLLRPTWVPGARISLSPDGKSIVGTQVHQSGDIWMLENLDAVPLWRRIFGRP